MGFVRQLATYSIAKAVDKKQVEKGQIVTYTVSLTNTSATTATSLVLTDQFSATATTLVGSATTSTGTFAPGASGGTWSLSSLAGGQSATLIFRAQLNEEGVIYKPLAKVTFGELGAHLDMLTSQIQADISRHRALTELHDMALAMGAIGDSCVFDVLGATEHFEAEVG